MTARGFRGDAKTLDAARLTIADGLWFLATVAIAVTALFVDGLLG